MNEKIDARGQACPRPVIMTKKALDELKEGMITTIVDNAVAKENVCKLANSLGCECKVDKNNENEYFVHIMKGKIEEINDCECCDCSQFKDVTIAFGSDTMGEGSDELGEILIKSFIYSLTESSPYPACLVFFNAGINLTCEGSEVLDDLKKLEEKGVEILSCGTCLDYFKMKDKLRIGEVTNMYSILEKLKNAANTVNL